MSNEKLSSTTRPAILERPLRIRFDNDRSAPVNGVWYPYSINLASELPQVVAAVRPLFGNAKDIAVNWRDFHRFPGLESPDFPPCPPLMNIVTVNSKTVTLLVIPPRTVASMAALLLHQVSGTTAMNGSAHTLQARRAKRIFEDAIKYKTMV